MIEKIKKMKLRDYFHLLVLVLCYLPSLIIKLIKPDIWIISENGDDAKDNGYAFFKFMMRKKGDTDCYYVISRNVSDYEKVRNYSKRIIEPNSLKHIIYTMACKNFVSSQLASAFPYPNIFFNLYMAKIFRFNYIFLQHGITKEKVKCFYKKDSSIDLFCCAANPEYDFVNKYFGYNSYEVAKTGFCRYDDLLKDKTNKDYILFMPTWRKNLEVKNNHITKKQEEIFLNSDYYKNIQGLISNKRLIKELEDNHKTMYFCLHDNASIYKNYFKVNTKNIIIVDKTYSKTINELIRECAYLITDTSSVAFDFAYQNKSILYYHFDYDDIIKNHWEKGYFDYEKDGFGKIVSNTSDCVDEIIKAIKNDFKNSQKYIDRTNDFFCYKDDNNSLRTYEAIKKLEEEKEKRKETERVDRVDKISYCNIILSIFLILLGDITNNYILMLSSILLIMFNNLHYGFSKFRQRIYFSLFNIAIFTFFIGKPLIKSIKGLAWWEDYGLLIQKLSLTSIYITLLCLFVGILLYDKIWVNCNLKKKWDNFSFLKIKNNKKIKKLVLICFLITVFFSFIMEIEKLLFMYGKDYTEFYLTYHSNLPSIVNLLGGMSTSFLVIYLCLFPRKKECIIPIILYLLLNVPNFIIGQRNPLVLGIMFVFCYYLYRDYLENRNYFIGVKEKVFILIMIPIAIVLLDVHNYIREDSNVKGSITESFVDFFYTQGISYDVLNIGYSNMENIRNMDKNYVFGPIVDYFSDNTIARKIFKMKGLGTGNNINKALDGHSFTHILAFLSRDDYLEGHGYGSSYILELYCNYGMFGVIVFSILLGYFLRAIPDILTRKTILSIITLYITTTIFFLPRSETVSSIMFLFKFQFWIPIVFFYFVSRKMIKEN